MNPILGYFLFVLQGRGVLVSTFSHTRADRLLGETAVLLPNQPVAAPFAGRYVSTWIDGVNPVGSTQSWLEIVLRVNQIHYDLIWFASASFNDRTAANILYWGEGMVINDQLVGAYWNHRIVGARP